ncbi:MAG TPA: DUF4390 domain-containing protein [Hydrogenophaga sp.]
MNNRAGFGLRLRAWFFVCALFLSTGLAWANEPRIVASGLQRSAQGLQLNVRLDLRATPAVEQALIKGVPVYFVWRAEMIRDRWYWYDKKESVVNRTLRLAYQPLTRRWRLSVSTESEADNGGLGLTYALHQSFDSLDAALAVVGRVAGWQVADASQMSDGELRVEWQFDLDLALLPRPFQLGMANDPDWRISVQQRLDVPPPVPPEIDQAGEPLHQGLPLEGVK